jgi:hypothetical protein
MMKAHVKPPKQLRPLDGVRPRCYWLGPNKSGKRMVPWCDTNVELDMVTLVWTRGENFPLKLLPERLRCPKCGLMKVKVWFEVPNQPNAHSVAAE